MTISEPPDLRTDECPAAGAAPGGTEGADGDTVPVARAGQPLDAFACFLVSQLGAYVAARFAEALRPLRLTPASFTILHWLTTLGGHSQQELATATDLPPNAVVGILDDLERRELVERRRHPQDRRAHAVHPTEAAAALLAEAYEAVADLEREVVAPLAPDAAEDLVRALLLIRGHTPLRPSVHPSLRRARLS